MFFQAVKRGQELTRLKYKNKKTNEKKNKHKYKNKTKHLNKIHLLKQGKRNMTLIEILILLRVA